MNFALAGQERRRRPSLTPLVDVVFLLLVFFMLAARFGGERTIDLVPGGSSAEAGGAYEGAPRLVDVTPGTVRLNGVGVGAEGLAAALGPLMPAPDAVVVVRARDGASLQDLVAVLDRLRAAGHANLVLVE